MTTRRKRLLSGGAVSTTPNPPNRVRAVAGLAFAAMCVVSASGVATAREISYERVPVAEGVFGAPMREWLRGPFGAYAQERLLGTDLGLFEPETVRSMLDEHRSGAADHSLHLWVLLNLVLWHDHWIAGRAL